MAPPADEIDHQPAAAITETHISVLVFVGDHAYKLKKPVRFPFADFTTREAREVACHREVELNRRLAPDVYLGVADISGTDGAPSDHLVVMRRMPDDRRLARLVSSGDPDAARHVDDVAHQLATFHATAERSPRIDRAASAGAVAELWNENFDELRTFAGSVIDAATMSRAEHLLDQFLEGRQALFIDRIAGGCACDGHGDLQGDDIFCLGDGARILDCIEFSDDLRYGDIANDVAFLAMDLERLGAPDLARRFIASYEAASGATIPPALLHLYIAYRAQVRAKVACLRTHQLEMGSADHDAATAAAQRLMQLCVAHLESATVRLVAVGGLPGTGKTTIATGLAHELSASLLRSDVVRKELADTGAVATAPTEVGYRSGLYADHVTDRVYDELTNRAVAELATGRSVVLDASFAEDRHRLAVRRLAADTRSDLTELCCHLDPEVAAHRIRDRMAAGNDASDATPEIASNMATTFAPWPEAVDVPTDQPAEEVVVRALAAVRAP